MFSRNKIIDKPGSFLIILLFVYTGASKLLSHTLFINQLLQVAFLQKIAPLVSVALPATEIVTGLLIAVKRTQLYGWWLASILMTLFTVYVSVMLLSGTSLPCTCGGVIASMTWKQHLYFNVFFMILTWFLLYAYYKEKNKNISTNKRKQAENL